MAAAGPQGAAADLRLGCPIHLAETEAQARAECEESLLSFYRYQARLQADSAARSAPPALRAPKRPSA